MVKPLNLEDAVRTLRRLQEFGNVTRKVDFEYPTAQQLLNMADMKPNAVIKFRIKITYLSNKQGGDASHLSAIQVVLSNGQSSPVFTA